MDAIQVVLYGSVSASFLNKAADDSKNKRSVLSYLRGAQKDGSVNRAGMDFCSQIVMEIEDTGTRIATCIGAAFEVGRNDSELSATIFSVIPDGCRRMNIWRTACPIPSIRYESWRKNALSAWITEDTGCKPCLSVKGSLSEYTL